MREHEWAHKWAHKWAYDDVLARLSVVRRDGRAEPIQSEWLVVLVVRLGDPVGMNDEHVTIAQRELRVLCQGTEAQ